MPRKYVKKVNQRKTMKRATTGARRSMVSKFVPVVYRFKRTTTITGMNQFNTAASVGTASKLNGYLIPTTTAAVANPAYYAFSIAFTLKDLPDYSDFLNLYDEYQISGVRLVLTSVFTDAASSTIGTSAPTGALIHMINDYDDNAIPTASELGVDVLRQYPGYRTYQLSTGRSIKRYIRPRVSQAINGTAGLVYYGTASRNQWIDMSSVDVQYYGIKGIIELYQTNANINYFPIKVEAVYYLTMKGVR